MMMMTEASDQLILTFGSKTHGGLLTEKRRDFNGNGHYKVLDSIDFYLEFRFYCFLPAELVAYK